MGSRTNGMSIDVKQWQNGAKGQDKKFILIRCRVGAAPQNGQCLLVICYYVAQFNSIAQFDLKLTVYARHTEFTIFLPQPP